MHRGRNADNPGRVGLRGTLLWLGKLSFLPNPVLALFVDKVFSCANKISLFSFSPPLTHRSNPLRRNPGDPDTYRWFGPFFFFPFSPLS